MTNNFKEALYNKMCELAKDHYVSIMKLDLARACDTYPSSSRFISSIKELENEGKIVLIQKATRNGQKYWSNFIWQIVKEVKVVNENNDKKISRINVDDFKVELFKDIPMRLYKTDKGYVVPISNIYKALGLDKQLFSQMIKINYELFEPWLVNVTLTSQKSGNKNTCLTRDGVIGALMKISYNRISEDKQKLVLDFQKWAIEKLTILISVGEVKLDEQEHAQVQSNISSIINVSETDMDLLFNQFEEDFTKFLESTKIMVKVADEKRNIAERKATDLEFQNKKWISKTQSLINKMHSYNVL